MLGRICDAGPGLVEEVYLRLNQNLMRWAAALQHIDGRGEVCATGTGDNLYHMTYFSYLANICVSQSCAYI